MSLSKELYRCALTFIKRNKLEEGLKYLELSAQKNNPEAQKFLGDYYYINREYEKAFINYKDSIENGGTEGTYNLANCYMKGIGTKRDESKALFFYKKASEKDINAKYCLSICYLQGYGIKKLDNLENSKKEGIKLLKECVKEKHKKSIKKMTELKLR